MDIYAETDFWEIQIGSFCSNVILCISDLKLI